MATKQPRTKKNMMARELVKLRRQFESTGDPMFVHDAVFAALLGGLEPAGITKAALPLTVGDPLADIEVPVPLWVLASARDLVACALRAGVGADGTGGRHSRPLSRAIDRGKDVARWRVVQELIDDGSSQRAAFKQAAIDLEGTESAGTAAVMRQSWERERATPKDSRSRFGGVLGVPAEFDMRRLRP